MFNSNYSLTWRLSPPPSWRTPSMTIGTLSALNDGPLLLTLIFLYILHLNQLISLRNLPSNPLPATTVTSSRSAPIPPGGEVSSSCSEHTLSPNERGIDILRTFVCRPSLIISSFLRTSQSYGRQRMPCLVPIYPSSSRSTCCLFGHHTSFPNIGPSVVTPLSKQHINHHLELSSDPWTVISKPLFM